jgi:hypothetical protein
MPGPVRHPAQPWRDRPGPSKWREMTVVPNQPPARRKPRRPCLDWLVVMLTLAFVWCGLCWLVQVMTAG